MSSHSAVNVPISIPGHRENWMTLPGLSAIVEILVILFVNKPVYVKVNGNLCVRINSSYFDETPKIKGSNRLKLCGKGNRSRCGL